MNVHMIGLAAALGVDLIISGTSTLHNDYSLMTTGHLSEIVEVDEAFCPTETPQIEDLETITYMYFRTPRIYLDAVSFHHERWV